jgi:hypothetical protein
MSQLRTSSIHTKLRRKPKRTHKPSFDKLEWAGNIHKEELPSFRRKLKEQGVKCWDGPPHSTDDIFSVFELTSMSIIGLYVTKGTEVNLPFS